MIAVIFVCKLTKQALAKRGGPYKPPRLSDSEVITMEVTGEWLGHHADKHIWEYFA